jgi:hypothetical protein
MFGNLEIQKNRKSIEIKCSWAQWDILKPMPLVDHEGNPYVEAVDEFGTLDN